MFGEKEIDDIKMIEIEMAARRKTLMTRKKLQEGVRAKLLEKEKTKKTVTTPKPQKIQKPPQNKIVESPPRKKEIKSKVMPAPEVQSIQVIDPKVEENFKKSKIAFDKAKRFASKAQKKPGQDQ